MASYFMSNSGRIFTSRRRAKIQLASEITLPYSMMSVISSLFYTFCTTKHTIVHEGVRACLLE